MDAVCAVRLRHRGAGGHGAADLLTEEELLMIMTSAGRERGRSS